jgi:hypothetical protein
MVDLENFTDKELQQLQDQFQRLREQQCQGEDNILDQIEDELEERQEERGETTRSMAQSNSNSSS